MKFLLITTLLAIFSVSLAVVQISNSDPWVDADWKFGDELENDTLWIPTFNGEECVASNVTIEDLDCSSDGACNTTLVLDKYKAWSISLDEDSFVKAIALVNKRLSLVGSLFIYNGTFNSSAPCDNLLFASHQSSLAWKNGLNFEFARWLESGTYWFVISAPAIPESDSEDYSDDDSSDKGDDDLIVTPSNDDYVVLHIWTADISGDIKVSNSSLLWNVPAATGTSGLLGSEVNATCTLNNAITSQPAFFVSSFFIDSDGSQSSGNNTSGWWDITAYFQGFNSTLILDQPVVALFKGDISAFLDEETSTGNLTDLIFDPCTDFKNFTLVAVVQGGLNDLTTRLTAQLVAGETYSIVISGTEVSDEGHIGVFVAPSVLENILINDKSNLSYSIPTILSDLEGNTTVYRCNTSEESTTVWNSFTFTAKNDFVLISVFSNNFEPWVAIYSGVPSFLNTSSSSSSNSSSNVTVTSDSCEDLLLITNTNDTGVIVLDDLDKGKEYTIIVTPSNSWLDTPDAIPLNGEYFLYVLSGTESGSTPSGTVTGLSAPTEQGLGTQVHVDVDVSSANEVAIGVALVASLFLMTFVF